MNPIRPHKTALTIVKFKTTLLSMIIMRKTPRAIVKGNGTTFELETDTEVVELLVLLLVLLDCITQILEVFV